MCAKTLHILFLLAGITAISPHTTCPNTEDIAELHKIVKQSCTKPISSNVPHCPPDVDLLFTCWGPVPANTTVTLPCPTKFPLPSGNISRTCRSNGRWDFPNTILHCPMVVTQERIADLVKEHKICEPDPTYPEWIDLNRNLDASLRILDAIVVFFGFVVLLILIPLKEDRIMLHRNLLVAFFLSDIQEIIQAQDMSITACSITYVFGLYFILAEICWMFNEGFYQFRAFYFVFITKKHKWAYFLFGWGFPALIVFVIYFPLMYHDPFTHPLLEKDPPFNYCWKNTKRYKYNYIVWGAGVAILLINLSITIYILRIVISKLRSQDIGEVQKAKKVSRGFFLLIILLGGGYMVTVYGPEDNLKFEAFRIIITSFQGILITVFHVFLSREVIDSGKKKLRKFLDNHNIDSRFLTNTSSMKSSTEVYQSYNKRFSIFDRKSSTTSTLRFNFFDRKSSSSSNSMPRVSVCSVDNNFGQGKSEIIAIPEHCEDENKNKTEECRKKQAKQNCILEETSSNNYDGNKFFGDINKMFSTNQVPEGKVHDECESCTDTNTKSDGEYQKTASKEKSSLGGEDSINIDRNTDTNIGSKKNKEENQDDKVNFGGTNTSDKLLDDENKTTKGLNSCQSESNFTKQNEISNKKSKDSIAKNPTGSTDISMDLEGISNEGFSDC